MNTPSSNHRESYKILRLIGALIVAIGAMELLNAMVGTEASTGDRPDAQSQRVEFPVPAQPARQIGS